MSTSRYASHPRVYRRYTLDEVADVFCRLTRGGYSGPERCRELIRELPYPLWERRRVRVADLRTDIRPGDRRGTLVAYRDHREAGSRFPPVILSPVECPVYDAKNGGDIYAWGGRWYTQEGNHRIRVAKDVGDEWIDAFVPVRPEGR